MSRFNVFLTFLKYFLNVLKSISRVLEYSIRSSTQLARSAGIIKKIEIGIIVLYALTLLNISPFF